MAFISDPASLQCMIHAISTRCRGTHEVYNKDWTAISAQISSQLLVPPQHSMLIQVCSSYFPTSLHWEQPPPMQSSSHRQGLAWVRAYSTVHSPHIPTPRSTGIGAHRQLVGSHQWGVSVQMLHTQLNTARTHPHPTSTPTRTCTLARLTSNEALLERPPHAGHQPHTPNALKHLHSPRAAERGAPAARAAQRRGRSAGSSACRSCPSGCRARLPEGWANP